MTLWLCLSGCPLSVDFPDRYALIYGVSDYIGSVNDLNYTDEDALAMDALLSSKGYITYLRANDPNNTNDTPLEPSRSQFLDDLDTMKNTLGREDMLLIYFSGHGGQVYTGGEEPPYRDADTEFIALYDAGNIESGFVYDDELAGFLNELPNRMKVLIIDACNSGGLIGGSSQWDMIPQDFDGSSYDFFTNLQGALSLYLSFSEEQKADIAAAGTIVLAAAGESETSWESGSIEHGVFTYYLLDAAQKGDANQDGYVSLLEAYEYTVNGLLTYAGTDYDFFPRISGSAVDFLLFTTAD